MKKAFVVLLGVLMFFAVVAGEKGDCGGEAPYRPGPAQHR